jgi:hypothetical protein
VASNPSLDSQKKISARGLPRVDLGIRVATETQSLKQVRYDSEKEFRNFGHRPIGPIGRAAAPSSWISRELLLFHFDQVFINLEIFTRQDDR